MDSITFEKFQARKMYNSKKNRFLSSFILHCYTALVSCLLCSSPYWLPPLYSSIKAFLFISLPSAGIVFFTPRCLFVVCNVIVIFLIGESKFGGSNSPPPADTYDEYVTRSASLRRQSSAKYKNVEETKLELSLVVQASETVNIVEEEEEPKEEKGDGGGETRAESVEEEVEEEAEEEEVGLPADELNKRAEDFIARINKQRMLEARQLCVIA